MKYEFRTDIRVLDIPIRLIFKSDDTNPSKEIKYLEGKSKEEISFLKIVDRILKLFGGDGFEQQLQFKGFTFREIEVKFDLKEKKISFSCDGALKYEPINLDLDFTFKFEELKTPQNEEAFLFEFILDEPISPPGNLPIVKNELKDNLQFVFGKFVIATDDIPERNISKGLRFVGKTKLFGSEQPIDLYLFGPARNNQTQRTRGAGGSEATPNKLTKWIEINKNLGPLTLQKIGFQFDDGMLWAMINTDLKMGPLNLSIEGLKVGSPIKFPPEAEDIKFGVNGVGLSMNTGPISITGAFLKDPNRENYYSGIALIQLSEFSIDAIGGYGELPNGDKAVFVFVSVDIPLGGPPFFFVKGFSLGFGYNMAFDIPPAKEIPAFPLINTAIFKGDASPTAALAKLNKYVYPKSGQLWFAVGIKFTCFELIDCQAVLVIDIGKIQISFLGVASLVNPKIGYAFINVKLGLVVIINIKEGYFLANASISDDSYVIHESCKVFGEFAFYVWMKGRHAGDFVFSLGGYHPLFKKPAHYPEVPRVGFNWRVSEFIHIGGNCYFTLTPSAVMAGFRFEAVFDIEVVKAWFMMVGDFLIQWKPFYYDAYFLTSIGVKVDFFLFSLKLERTVEIRIYGPPVGGYARVDVSIFAFTIEFGGINEEKAPLLDWGQFKENFLPAPAAPESEADTRSVGAILPDEVCRVNIGGGLLKKGKNDEGEEIWLVREDELILNTESVIPVKELKLSFWGTSDKQETVNIANDKNASLGIRPMGLTALHTSLHEVKITHTTDTTEKFHWQASSRTGVVPAALWAPTPINGNMPEAETIPAANGLQQIYALPLAPPEAEMTKIKNFDYLPFTRNLPLKYETDQIHSVLVDMNAMERGKQITNTIMATQTERLAIIDEVNAFFQLDTEGSREDLIVDDLRHLGEGLEENFQSMPRIGYIYKQDEKTSVQPIVPRDPDDLTPPKDPDFIYLRLRKSLRQYSPGHLADYTLIQEGLLKDADRLSLRVHEGAHYLFDLKGIKDKSIHFEGGKLAQVLVFNSTLNLIQHHISSANNTWQIPQDARYLSISGLPTYASGFYVCGWTAAHTLPVIHDTGLLGSQFVLHPRAPIHAQKKAWIDLKTALAKNAHTGDENKQFRAWTDTQFLHDEVKEVVVLVKVKKQAERLTERIKVSIPYKANGAVNNLRYQNIKLTAIGEKNMDGYTRIRYKIPASIRGSKMFAIRPEIPDKYQKNWEIYGVIGLCSSQNIPSNAWLKSNLSEMTYQASPSGDISPSVEILS